MLDVARYRERFEAELSNVTIPDLALIERAMPTPPPLSDIARAVDDALAGLPYGLPRGRVAVAVGSRGIARLGEFVAAVVSALRRGGAEPFVVPAMGSHGASTAQGQADVLAHLGVSEATVGAPIRATMETVEIGRTPSGLAVYMDVLAHAADAIVAINRVKPHTSYRGPIESGPAKMLAIGLGKKDGARSVHSLGWAGMRESVPAAARVAIATGKIAFALAILENANEAPCRVEAMAGDAILDREPSLLVEAMGNLARLPLDTMDVLIVDRIGKSISGGGGDPNVTGRFPSEYISGGPTVTRLVYCAMAHGGDGNANGVGLADVVTSELAEHVDPLPTYLNALTTTAAGNVRMPMVMPTKALAVAAALRMCPDLDPARATIVRVLDTLHLRRMWVSRAALEAIDETYEVLVAFGSPRLDAGYDRL